jgi:hypothetical protein
MERVFEGVTNLNWLREMCNIRFRCYWVKLWVLLQIILVFLAKCYTSIPHKCLQYLNLTYASDIGVHLFIDALSVAEVISCQMTCEVEQYLTREEE